nr:MAG TPA: hypothetical protein [Caudoviricetes sp.]
MLCDKPRSAGLTTLIRCKPRRAPLNTGTKLFYGYL